ncbi:MAG: LOG family protein [Planctomycetes bacterium]|nr:LOG family protein [Planctomycetota bacterium]
MSRTGDGRTVPEGHSRGESFRDLLSEFAGSENLDMASEMIQTTLHLMRDQAARADMKLLNRALKEWRYAFKVFASYRHLRKVSVFGSARTPKESPDYEQGVRFGERISAKGYMVITGAGSGIMQAAQDGAGRDLSFGVNIRLPFEQSPNPVIRGDPKLVTFKYFFTRKLMFIKETHAVVCLPGGFGTLDEAFESLTLIQTGKSYLMPIVLLDAPGGDYWRHWDDFVRRQLLARGLISEEDLSLYFVTDSVDRACEEIVGFYRTYHSIRYVRRSTVFRLHRCPTPAELRLLNRDFKDILEAGGEFRLHAGPLPEERDEPDLESLSRLVFPFNRRNMGRLRQLVNRLNENPR